MNRRIKKFWLICASVVGAGFILFIVGYLTGGVESMDKLSDKYSWINVPSEERISEKLQGEEFSSIQIDGYADVQIYQGEETSATAYYSDDMTRPEMYVENGADGEPRHVGYVIAGHWLKMFAPIELPVNL